MTEPTPTTPLLTQRRLDRLGILWSALCAVHCFAIWALAASAALAPAHHDDDHHHDHHDHGGSAELIEVGLAVGASLIAIAALARGVRLHGDRRPLGVLLIGLAALTAARVLDAGEVGEVALSVAGAASLIGAHVWNLRLATRCGKDCC